MKRPFQKSFVRCQHAVAGALLISSAASSVLAANPVQQRETVVPSSAVRIITWTEGDAPHYRVTSNGGETSEPRLADYRIKLQGGAFDPLADLELANNPKSPIIEAATSHSVSRGTNGDRQLYIVQFIAPPSDELIAPLRNLADHDVVLRRYLPEYAWVVEMTATAAQQVQAMPHVRWVGPFFDEYKLENAIVQEFTRSAGSARNAAQAASIPTRRYNVLLFERGVAAQERVSQRIAELGGIVHTRVAEGFRLEATLTGAQLLEVIAMNDVHYADRWGPGGLDMDLARQIGGAVPLLSNLGFTGQGVRGEVMDNGVRLSHQAFQGPAPLLHGPNPPIESHGTNTYGIVFGNGAALATGTGMLPNREQGIFALYPLANPPPPNFSRYTHTAELIDPVGPYRAVFQSNSWGGANTTLYTSKSAEMDDILFLNPIIVCQSMGNTNNRNCREEAWAKNNVAVGGIFHQNTLARNDDAVSPASFGPAADGRVKPDLSHFYESVLCTTSATDTAYTASFFGTSASTPIVCGHFGLLMQMWHQGVFSGFGGQATVFASRPAMATAKAMMINSAFRYEWTAGGANASLTRDRQGWGMPDLAQLYNDRNKIFIVNQTDALTPFASRTYIIRVPVGEPQLRATMSYTDPMGNPLASVARINDLSLKVTAPNGVTFYWGNSGLILSNESFANGNPNTIDTVENVFVKNPTPGDWTVTVFGDQIVQDARLSTPQMDADFALVVVGGTLAFPCPADINGDHTVGVPDLLAVIAAWGACPIPPTACPADIAPEPRDNVVGVPDLLAVIAAWGACP